MPVDLQSSVNSISNYTFGNSILSTLLGSSVMLTLVISITMVLIIMVVYPAKSGTSITVLIKMFIYMVLVGFTMIFLHDGICRHRQVESQRSRELDDLIIHGGAKNTIYGNYEAVPVINTHIGGAIGDAEHGETLHYKDLKSESSEQSDSTEGSPDEQSDSVHDDSDTGSAYTEEPMSRGKKSSKGHIQHQSSSGGYAQYTGSIIGSSSNYKLGGMAPPNKLGGNPFK